MALGCAAFPKSKVRGSTPLGTATIYACRQFSFPPQSPMRYFFRAVAKMSMKLSRESIILVLHDGP
jgi:hypothetical protein